MKSATPFLGVRVPAMQTLTRGEARLRPFATSADLIDTVLRLWREAAYREERYAAITRLDTPAARRHRDPALLPALEELIVTGAWWDYVDELAHRVGDLLLGWPAEVRPAVLTWTRSDDRWLRRASIICQLGTRDRADVELLTIAIESAIDDSDFFLRKAIGWALRDYARTDPAWVRSFAENPRTEPVVTTRGAETLAVSTHRRTHNTKTSATQRENGHNDHARSHRPERLCASGQPDWSELRKRTDLPFRGVLCAAS
jgi:3-methyladenine DNA glycosylase AlkD